MGQKYEGTLIIQTTNDYSPVGSQTLAALENSAFSDDILSGKSLYSQNGQLLKGSFVDGWPIEIGTEEEMDAFATLDNVERYVKYVENNASVQPEPIVVGDTITQLYFNTSVVPDFSLLDWSSAVDDGSGAKILVLMNGQGLSDIDAPLYVYKIDNSHPEAPSLQGAVYQLVADFSAIYTHCSSATDEAFCETELGVTPNQWDLSGNSITFDQIVVAAVNQQDIWGAYIAKEPFGVNETPAPVNPIKIGDTITKLYFNTSVTPDIGALKAAIEADGGYDEKGGGYAIMFVSGHDVMLIPRSDETPDVFSISYYNAEIDRSVEAFNGETNSWTEEATTGFSGTVEELYGQSAWGAYLSKDGQWTSGAKYTSGQVYKVVQNGDIAELKEIQY